MNSTSSSCSSSSSSSRAAAAEVVAAEAVVVAFVIALVVLVAVVTVIIIVIIFFKHVPILLKEERRYSSTLPRWDKYTTSLSNRNKMGQLSPNLTTAAIGSMLPYLCFGWSKRSPLLGRLGDSMTEPRARNALLKRAVAWLQMEVRLRGLIELNIDNCVYVLSYCSVYYARL